MNNEVLHMNIATMIAAVIMTIVPPQADGYDPMLSAYDTESGSPHHRVTAWGFPPESAVVIRADDTLKRIVRTDEHGHFQTVIRLERGRDPRTVQIEAKQAQTGLSASDTVVVGGSGRNGWVEVRPQFAGRRDTISIEGHTWEPGEKLKITYRIGQRTTTEEITASEWGGMYEIWRVPASIEMGHNLEITVRGNSTVRQIVELEQPAAIDVFGDPADAIAVAAYGLEPLMYADVSVNGTVVADLMADRDGWVQDTVRLPTSVLNGIKQWETTELVITTGQASATLQLTARFPELEE